MTIEDQIRRAIEQAIPDAEVTVASGDHGHFQLQVRSSAFRGKGMIESHRLVYSAIAPLMAGNAAPVHAIDRLQTHAL